MRRGLSGVLLVALLLPLWDAAPASKALTQTEGSAGFLRGNESYEKGDYEAAVASYSALVDEGIVDADLFYNLGNAHYKLGRLGHAILYYERARRLAPRDGDIAHNLSLARSLLRDSQFVSEEGWFRRGALWLHDNLNASESFALASVLYVLLSLAIIAFVFRRTSAVSSIYDRLSVLSPGRLFGFQKSADLGLAIGILLFLTSTVSVSAWTKERKEAARNVAVILEEEVAVYSGPSEDVTLQFKVHEGTLVDIRDVRAGWWRVELPGELSGWIRSQAAERV